MRYAPRCVGLAGGRRAGPAAHTICSPASRAAGDAKMTVRSVMVSCCSTSIGSPGAAITQVTSSAAIKLTESPAGDSLLNTRVLRALSSEMLRKRRVRSSLTALASLPSRIYLNPSASPSARAPISCISLRPCASKTVISPTCMPSALTSSIRSPPNSSRAVIPPARTT